MEERIKKILTYICIIIIIIIVFRIIYLNKNNAETFAINNTPEDLLSYKNKSSDIIKYSNTNEILIHPWTNKIYNMQNTSLQQVKPIAFYKPNLMIKNVQYCKLGDMVSQNINYSLPSINEFTLLIKKLGSDIKPPSNLELVVDIGDKDINRKYYEYINNINDLSSINNILPNLLNCSLAFNNIKTIIKNNIPILQTTLKDLIYKSATITLGKVVKSVNYLVNPISISILNNQIIKLPAGIVGNIVNVNNISTDINISQKIGTSREVGSSIDSYIDSIINELPIIPYGSLTRKNIKFEDKGVKFFQIIPKETTITYIKNLCLDIKNISNKNPNLLKYLKLADDKETVNGVLNIIEGITNNTTFDLNTFNKYVNTNTLLGIVFKILLNSQLFYSLVYLEFTTNEIGINKPNIINIKSFNNDIVSNIPPDSYDIKPNMMLGQIDETINSFSLEFNKFMNFSQNLKNDSEIEFPLQIYNPIAPEGYKCLGHVFTNFQSDLEKYNFNDEIACVPAQCVKEIRDWVTTDKIYEYNKNNIYWAIYYNPYTGTFISTNKKELPLGKVSKVVACVAKCNAVEDLKKADECARKYYNINKKAMTNTPIISNLASDQEEEFYLNKIKAQSDSIAKLGQRAQQMQIVLDKANIVNREMNKNKLQNYVDVQKRNIDIIMKRLIDDKNKIRANINVNLPTLNSIIEMIKNSENISPEVKSSLIKKIIETQKQSDSNIITGSEYVQKLNQVLSSCPEYDLSGLVKKSTVSDVCYGCDSP